MHEVLSSKASFRDFFFQWGKPQPDSGSVPAMDRISEVYFELVIFSPDGGGLSFEAADPSEPCGAELSRNGHPRAQPKR